MNTVMKASIWACDLPWGRRDPRGTVSEVLPLEALTLKVPTPRALTLEILALKVYALEVLSLSCPPQTLMTEPTYNSLLRRSWLEDRARS